MSSLIEEIDQFLQRPVVSGQQVREILLRCREALAPPQPLPPTTREGESE